LSNATDAEATITGRLTAFNTDSFSIGTSSEVNNNGETYVAWCWKANGGTTVTNTDGAVTNTLQVNQDAGFSIGSWTGTGVQNASIGHGLSQAPEIIIYRNRSAATNWDFMTTLIDGSYDYLYLNLTNTKGNAGETSPSDTLAYMWSGIGQNRLNDNYVGYFFHSVDGFSKFGTYAGNGTSQSINIGFQPDLLILRKYDDNQDWMIWDSVRDGNPKTLRLEANNADAEVSGTTNINFISTGFELTSGFYNDSGKNSIYMAFKIN
jgi:hypothetical protein